MSHHLRVVGPDERAPRLIHRLYAAAEPARLAAGGLLLRAAAHVAGESLTATGWGQDDRVAARVVGIGRTQAPIRATLVTAAQELLQGWTPEPAG